MGLSIEEQRNKIRERERLEKLKTTQKTKPKFKKSFVKKSKKPKQTKSYKKLKSFNQKKGANYRNNLIERATKHELILKDALIELGIQFSFQKLVFDFDRTYILDFYLKTHTGRYAIELDGYHHFTEKGRKYDKNRSDWLFKRRRIKTFRFTNSDIENNLNKCITEILLLQPRKLEC